VGGENRGGGAHSFCFLVRVKARLSWLAPGLSPTTSWSRSRGKRRVRELDLHPLPLCKIWQSVVMCFSAVRCHPNMEDSRCAARWSIKERLCTLLGGIRQAGSRSYSKHHSLY
jgi:hypothetical protein